MLKAKDIMKFLEGVDPETPVVIYDGDVGEDAWECEYVAHYTSANLYDEENDVDPAVSCPYDGGYTIKDLAAKEKGVIVLANYLPDYCRMPGNK